MHEIKNSLDTLNSIFELADKLIEIIGLRNRKKNKGNMNRSAEIHGTPLSIPTYT